MKRFLILLAAFTVLVMSWEHQLGSAQPVGGGPIPEKSIRLRIIANSDSFQDQWLKREVRDVIVARMNTWAREIRSYEEARSVVSQRLPELKVLVEQTIRDRGFTYSAEVDFGRVPFPTKQYGAYVYPAGEYEALRVRIGEAKGQNWWCVLFPPLCFIDMADGDAVATTQTDGNTSPDETDSVFTGSDESEALDGWFRFFNPLREDVEDAGQANEDAKPEVEPAKRPELEVRFYLWDKLVSFFG